MSLFDQYQNEDQFRDEFIKPLLVRMGFIGITNKHGPAEMGKDFVFSELDKFGVMRNMAVQAKHETTINQGKKVDDLLSQIRQCFNCSYYLPTSPSEERFISAVYVFNTGKITDNATEHIRMSLPKEWQVSTFFYSGHQLETLGQVIAREQDRFTHRRFNAITTQFKVNEDICNKFVVLANNIINGQKFSWETRELMLSGVESYLNQPLISDDDLIRKMNSYWQCAKNASFVVQRYAFSNRKLDDLHQDELCRHDMGQLLKMCFLLVKFSNEIVEQFRGYLLSLPDVVIEE